MILHTREENIEWLLENVYEHAMPQMKDVNRFIHMMAKGMILMMLKDVIEEVYTDEDLAEMREMYESTSLGKKMIAAAIKFAALVSDLDAATGLKS
jgi:hypothetical protein